MHEHAEHILEETTIEIEEGYAGQLYHREQFDALYGAGNWRPIPGTLFSKKKR